MKIFNISTTNAKGQIVIPKKMREALGITKDIPLTLILREGGIYIEPIKETLVSSDNRQVYLQVLEKTRGSWSGDNWEKTEKRRRKIELRELKLRRKAW